MAIASVINFFQVMGSGDRLGPADHWDSLVETVSPTSVSGGIFQGYSLNWGGFDSQASISPIVNQFYSGYNTNWGQIEKTGTLNGFVNNLYVGYNTNWGEFDSKPIGRSISEVDDNTIIDHPKDKKIWYKLRGWNPLTSTYESWVISQNVTGRPSLDGGIFDPIPGREPPNVERDVFKTPPSGNNLTNIIIVARWLE